MLSNGPRNRNRNHTAAIIAHRKHITFDTLRHCAPRNMVNTQYTKLHYGIVNTEHKLVVVTVLQNWFTSNN